MPADALPDNLREFDDTAATRRLVYGNVLESLKKRFPVEDDTHRLELVDARYDGPQEFSLRQQKQALLHNRNLRTPIRGTWRLTDKRTGQVLEERDDVVMQVPYWTDRGTIINNGSEYTVISQSRLRPGVYARRKSNGEFETQFNVKPGTGHGFHLGIAPETGVMTLRTGQGQIPLYQVLRGLGVDDKEIVRYWGSDVAAANSQKQDAQAWNKLYSRMAGSKANAAATEEEKQQFIRERLAKYEVDPEVVERTMGLRNCPHVTPELLLRASQKMLGLSRGDERPDNRDNPRFSKFYGVEDYFKERIDNNAGRLANNLLFKAKRRGLSAVQRNALNPWVDTVLQGSGLAMPGEEANPLSTLEQMSRISKFGMGGIASPEAVTMEARDVQGDYLGFVDPIAGPECLLPDTQVFTKNGWVAFRDLSTDDELACYDSEYKFLKPERIVDEEYDGDMYYFSFDGGEIDATPGHRMWICDGDKWFFTKACELFNHVTNDRVTYSVSTSPYFPVNGCRAPIFDARRYPYSGKVMCATVPGGMMFVRKPGSGAHWTGNSEKIGVDVRASYRTFKGRDNKLYGEFIDNKTGKKAYVDIATASDRLVAFPGQDMSQPYVVAMKDGIPQKVPTKDVRYTVPTFAHMMGSNTNMNPMPTAVQTNRQFYGSKFWSQYLPQKNGEVPLVDSLMDDGKTTWSEYYGRKVGTLKSQVGGTVIKVNDDEVTVKGDDGKLYKTEMVKALPFNRLSAISYFPSVQQGQRVKAGDMLAHSNFTDAKTGAINMGQNLHVAIVPARGWTYEDGHCISASAAKRLATDRLYSFDHEAKNGVVIDKKKYMASFPSKFTKEQFETLDDNGVVKTGTVLHRGDPMVVSLGPKLLTSSDKALGKLSKALRNSYTDRTETWEHDYEGTVVDAVMTPQGAKVNVSASPPVRPGDKLSGRFGLKGVVAKVVDDDKMPRDAVTNQPYDMLVNPMGFLSRVAPGQLMEISLGKVAKATGKQMRLPQLPPKEGWYNWTVAQMKANNVPETSDMFDPDTGKTIKGLGDGYMFVSAFHHLAEKKASARGGTDGSFSQDEQPAKGGEEGAKRSSGLDLWAMLSHNVPEVIKDIQTTRGTRNDDYWRALQLGLPIPEPDEPFIYRKFLNTLRAGGVNVTEKGSIVSIMPQTDKDVEKMAQGRVIDSSEMVDPDFEPMKGGLFDLGKTGGMAGNQWSMIKLPEPVPNPIMEEPVRRVLGLTVKEMEEVLSGRRKIDGKTGGAALKDALSKVDVDRRMKECEENMRTKRGASRDDAVKQYRYLSAMKKQGLSPSDWMISNVPVIPPIFRPVSKMGDVALVSDLNRLYKDVIENVHNFNDLKGDVDDDGLVDERLNIYGSVKAAYGLGQPITPENAAKGVKGAIRQVMGNRPKFGMFQSKVLSKPVGGVSRGVTAADPNLDMDQLGMPEDMAWKTYKPYVMRSLVQHGYPATTAIKMIADRTETARHLLEKEMSSRPVIMDRAPTWHKFNFMAFTPHIVEGKTIHVSPLVDSAFNMDHDGDQEKCIDIQCFVTREFFEKWGIDGESRLKYNPCLSTPPIGDRQMYKDATAVINGESISGSVVRLNIDDFPHIDAPTLNRHPNAEFYAVPDGIYVRAYDEASKTVVWAPVKYWSHHGVNEKLEIVVVNLSSGRQILTDDDPRGVYGIDPATFEFGRWRPSEAVGKFVPRAIGTPIRDPDLFELDLPEDRRLKRKALLDRKAGWFFGAMVGDGWCSYVSRGDNAGFKEVCFCFDAGYNDLGDTFIDSLKSTFTVGDVTISRNEQTKDASVGKYGQSIRLSFSDRVLSEFIDSKIGHGAENKHLPAFWQRTPYDFRLGLLEGLIDTDGSVAVSHGKKNPQLIVNFSSTSSILCLEVQSLLRTFGVESSISSTKTPAGKPCWLVNISSKRIKSLGLQLKSRQKAEKLASADVSGESRAGGRRNMVPVPVSELSGVQSVLLKSDSSAYVTWCRTTKKGYVPTSLARKVADVVRGRPELQTALWMKWLSMYDKLDEIVWDRVESYENSGIFEDGYDLTVPGYETFMNGDGVVLSNTVNLHVPSSDKAVKQAMEKMLPSKNLTSLTDLKSPRHPPSKEQIFGLYSLTKGLSNKPVKRYPTVEAAKEAFRNGEIGPNDPIEIGRR